MDIVASCLNELYALFACLFVIEVLENAISISFWKYFLHAHGLAFPCSFIVRGIGGVVAGNVMMAVWNTVEYIYMYIFLPLEWVSFLKPKKNCLYEIKKSNVFTQQKDSGVQLCTCLLHLYRRQIQFFSILEAGSLGSRCWQLQCLLRA